jgi:xylulokinase
MRPATVARAAFEGVLCHLTDALDHLTGIGVTPRRVLLIGGGARSRLIARIAAQVFGVTVTIPEPAEYVALGAARQAAWALSGASRPPSWPARSVAEIPAPADAATGREIRAGYRRARRALYG